MTFIPRFTITNAITDALTRIERVRGFLEAAQLSDDWLSDMQDRAFLLEAHHTTHIEGTHLSLDQAERILAGETIPGTDPEDVREVLNYRNAFEYVSGYLDSGEPITEQLIREIHERLVRGVRGGAAAPGSYRTVQNYVVNTRTREIIYTPPPATDVSKLMEDMVDWLGSEQEIHPVLMAGIAQFQFVHIHPFIDGNGRTARLLSTLCLYRSGYDFKRLFTISEYYDRNRPAYYNAIQKVRENDLHLTGWLHYFCWGLATQMHEVQERGERVIRQDVLTHKHNLSQRQQSALKYVLMHERFSIHNYEALCPDTSRRTLQRDLKEMVMKGIFETEGTAASTMYRLKRR